MVTTMMVMMIIVAMVLVMVVVVLMCWYHWVKIVSLNPDDIINTDDPVTALLPGVLWRVMGILFWPHPGLRTALLLHLSSEIIPLKCPSPCCPHFSVHHCALSLSSLCSPCSSQLLQHRSQPHIRLVSCVWGAVKNLASNKGLWARNNQRLMQAQRRNESETFL